MTFSSFDNDFDVTDFFDFLFQKFNLGFTNAGINSARPPVGHDPFDIQSAEVGAGSDITGFQINP